MLSRNSFRFALLPLAILAIAIVAALPPFAQADVVSHARVVRLSFVEGDVAYQSAGSDWQRAVANLPIREGFALRTDTGYAEVEFETGLVIHLAGNTQLEFTELNLTDGRRVTSLKLDQGTIIATANLQKGDQISVASGNAVVTVPRSGRFRIDSAQSQNWVTVFHGKVDVANGGNNTAVENGKTLHYAPALQGEEQNQSSLDRSPRTDAFDKWSAEREQAQENAQTDAGEFVRNRDYAFSTADLYNYGLWSNISGYGMAWQPYGMGANWMPFSNGMWMFDDMGADWMWASAEPWGWLPYHYGGWVYIEGEGWFWIPQNLGFFQGGNANFVNVGNQVGWTPTAPTPVNPKKIRISPVTPTRVVFAGGGAKGVIVAGPRGILGTTTTVKTASSPAATFVQGGAPSVASLGASGVIVTSRGPMAPGNMTRTYTAHTAVGAGGGRVVGTGAPKSGGPGNLGAPNNLSAPGGRPTAMAPHSSPAPVMRAPSTFAVAGSGGRSSGVTPVNASGFSGGSQSTGGTMAGPTGAPTSSASNGSSGRPAGGTAPAGGTGQAGGGVAPGGTGTKH